MDPSCESRSTIVVRSISVAGDACASAVPTVARLREVRVATSASTSKAVVPSRGDSSERRPRRVLLWLALALLMLLGVAVLIVLPPRSGYGWPSQCRAVTAAYEDAIANASVREEGDRSSTSTHAFLVLQRDALDGIIDAVAAEMTDGLVRELGVVSLPFVMIDIPLTLGVRASGARLVTENGEPYLRAPLTIDVSASVPALAARVPVGLRAEVTVDVALAMVSERRGVALSVVPSRSTLRAFSIAPTGAASLGGRAPEARAAASLIGVVDPLLRRTVLSVIPDIVAARIAPIRLGGSSLEVQPVAMNADAETGALNVALRFNTPIPASAHIPAPPESASDIALSIHPVALRSLVDGSGVADAGLVAPDRHGRPSSTRIFIEDIDVDEGNLVITYRAFSFGTLCSEMQLQAVLAPAMVDGTPSFRIVEAEILGGSRPRWMAARRMPPLDLTNARIAERLSALTGEYQLDLLPGVELAIQPNAIALSESVLVFGANVSLSRERNR